MTQQANTATSLTAALICNPGSGSAGGDDGADPDEMRRLLAQEGIHATCYMVESGAEIDQAANDVLKHDFPLVIVYAGDGTIETVANALVGTQRVLGILPGGTRNNLAASLSIPTELPQAVQVLRQGQRRAIDAAHAACNSKQRWFFELLTVGLMTKLFEDAEAIQKGRFTAIADLIAAFAGAAPAAIHLGINGGQHAGTALIQAEGHAVLGLNTPYLGANYRFADDIAWDDGLLDLFVYDRMSKLDLLAHTAAVVTNSDPDPRIRRLRAREFALTSDPPLPILVDGVPLGEGAVTVRVRHQALNVMTGPLT